MSKTKKVVLALVLPFAGIIFSFVFYALINLISDGAGGALATILNVALFAIGVVSVIGIPVGIIYAIVVGLSDR